MGAVRLCAIGWKPPSQRPALRVSETLGWTAKMDASILGLFCVLWPTEGSHCLPAGLLYNHQPETAAALDGIGR